MEASKLTVDCPYCASRSIVYTCEPECCFNHVCNDCLKSFELTTRDLGESMENVTIGSLDRESTDPTVACARCQSLDVYSLNTDKHLGCGSCQALLMLEVES